MTAPQVGQIFTTEGGYKAVVAEDFLLTEKKIDQLGCRYGGYLLTPGRDTYVWWRPDGVDPRRTDSSLIDRWRGEHDPVFQPVLEQHPGTPRAQGHFYSRFEDIQREWAAKTETAIRLQRTDTGIISHIVSLK
jgi:hypothetical protein